MNYLQRVRMSVCINVCMYKQEGMKGWTNEEWLLLISLRTYLYQIRSIYSHKMFTSAERRRLCFHRCSLVCFLFVCFVVGGCCFCLFVFICFVFWRRLFCLFVFACLLFSSLVFGLVWFFGLFFFFFFWGGGGWGGVFFRGGSVVWLSASIIMDKWMTDLHDISGLGMLRLTPWKSSAGIRVCQQHYRPAYELVSVIRIGPDGTRIYWQ